MIQWDRIGGFNRPASWDETAEDGVFGDVEDLIQSVNTGEQGIIYAMRYSNQGDNLSRFSGTSGGEPRAPEPLADLEPEAEDPTAGDAWE